MSFSEKIPIICGPTGAGKTKLALTIAKKIPIEIVSADTRQLIRKLDIGTAKPTKEEQNQVRFHLIDIINPGDSYSAFQFIKEAELAISEILSREKLPIVVGGSGLYLKALTEGVFDIDSEYPEVRLRLEKEMAELGAKTMYNKLKNVDPVEAAKTHLNNKVRVTRALEIYYLTGVPKSEMIKKGHNQRSRFEFQFYCLLPDRKKLYNTVDARVDKMLKSGLLNEVRGLVNEGMAELVQKMNVIGYNELFQHITGNMTLNEAVLLIKQNSRRYAKRQFTWFRHQIKGDYFTSSVQLKKAFFKNYAYIARG